MTLEQMETFVAIYRSGSFQKASEKLYIPQPTVSHRINQLEKELGKSLFMRGKREIKLTPEGEAFLPFALKALAAVIDGRDAIELVKKGAIGKLTIGCNNSYAACVLPRIIASFLSRYPDISVQVHTYAANELVRLIKNKEFQVAITRYTSNDPHLSYHLLHSEPTMLIVSTSHPMAKAGKVNLEEALREPVISYPRETQYSKELEASLNQQNVKFTTRFETNNLQLIKWLVARNAGVFFYSPSYMQQEIERGELIAVPLQDDPFPRSQTYLMYYEDPLNSLDQLLIRHLKEHYWNLTGIG
ncbi:LysR family transcriptional regulator [Paenibacillus thalictri]|uniref:LysR family transcriptional regulator n=1 Tax=Paenibacillus thalictri TaxID=2527873 RepID=A0A4Q9E075_9BACL|nr:LysR family transcriptional regulator [Paenibacillus thalictri]TBL81523.1 LysR family transcriptional regulator [Paenibacillus thalictri]